MRNEKITWQLSNFLLNYSPLMVVPSLSSWIQVSPSRTLLFVSSSQPGLFLFSSVVKVFSPPKFWFTEGIARFPSPDTLSLLSFISSLLPFLSSSTFLLISTSLVLLQFKCRGVAVLEFCAYNGSFLSWLIEEGEEEECSEVLGNESLVLVVGMFGMGNTVVLTWLAVWTLVEEGVVLVGHEVALSPSILRTRSSVTLLSQTCVSSSWAVAEEEDEREMATALPQLGTTAWIWEREWDSLFCCRCFCAFWLGCDSCLPFSSPPSSHLFLFPVMFFLSSWPGSGLIVSVMKTSSEITAVALLFVVEVAAAPLSPTGLDLLLLPACNEKDKI